jgi:hypothetical protein
MVNKICVWISKEKDMIAFYTKGACINIFLRREGLEEDEVQVEFYIGDKLMEMRFYNAGEDILTLEDIVSFLSST